MTTVAIVGLGRMGAPMARNAVSGGLDVAIFDADADLTARVAADLDVRALRRAQDFEHMDFVVTMLPTGKVVANVLFDWDGGIVNALPDGAIVVDMSSSDPSDTLTTARRAAEQNVYVIDAPVSGGVQGAIDGTLTVMLGGDDAQASTATPVLKTMSARIVRTGPVGSGHAMKALNNVVAGATTIACFEALEAGRHFGLSPETMVDVWNSSTAQSFVTTKVFAPEVVTGTYASGYSLPLYAKDVAVAASMLDEAGVDGSVCATTAERFRDALERLGDVDHTRIADLYNITNGSDTAVVA